MMKVTYQNTITDLEMLHGRLCSYGYINSIIFGQMPSVTMAKEHVFEVLCEGKVTATQVHAPKAGGAGDSTGKNFFHV